MGSIYRRPRSKYLWIKYYQNGRVVRESTGTTKETVARRMLRVREGDVERGIPITPKSGRVTFEEAAADMINDYTINGKKSLEDVQRRIDLHLTPYFQGKRMATITTTDIRAYIAQRMAAKASNAEINRELSALKRMYSLSCQAGKLHARPHIPMLQERNVRTGFFEFEQFIAVRRHLPSALQPVVTFAYLTGWRVPSEVLTLQWRQIDLKAGTVRLDPGTTKNDQGRLLPYGDVLPDISKLLEEQRQATKAVERARDVIVPWVFHRNGKKIRDFRGAWEAACKAAGCPGRIPHDFRRTAVRNLSRANVPEQVAMQITGHKTRSVFDRYRIVDEADLRDGLKKLAGTLPGTLTLDRAKGATSESA